MPASLIAVEAMNLFVGTADPTASKHLSLMEVKLPMLQEKYADHSGAGSLFDIEVFTGIQKLEPTFKLAGYDLAVLSEFGYLSNAKTLYTMRGSLRDKVTGADVALKAVVEGRLGKIEGDSFKRGDLFANDYAINEVYYYELWFDGAEKYRFDWKNSLWIVDGVQRNAKQNANLGLI